MLRDVSLAIAPGEIAVLVGRSGSGKSTLLNLIAGIDRPTAGRVLVDGTDLTALDEDARTRFRRRHIGFVFQFFNLIPLLTVEENLLLPLELNGGVTDAGMARARALLDRVGLGGRGSSLPERLSGGEQQRVAIARAVVHDPGLILADEPTGTLDVETAAAVLELLDTLVRESGKTVIMVTHSREVVGVADRIFAAERGQLVERRRRRPAPPDDQATRAHRAPLSPAASVAAHPRGARHRARRGRRRLDRPRQRERAARLRARHRGGHRTAPLTRSWAGRPGFPDALYRALRVDLGARAAAPVLTGDVAAIDFPGRAFTVLGVDPFAEAPFRPYLGPADGRSPPMAGARRTSASRPAPVNAASRRRAIRSERWPS